MVVLRRILTGLLVVALTQFGVMATVPAHAHEAGAGHGVREIVLSHGHSDVELSTDQHAHGIDHDDHDMSFDGDDFGSPSDQDDSSRGEHAHVHAFSQFTPSVEIAASVELVAYAEIVRPIETTAAISHSSYPPLRPPRTIL